MKFNKIVAIEPVGLTKAAFEELEKYTQLGLQEYPDAPGSDTEIIARISDAEAILVSWNTRIPAIVLGSCPQLKYVGLCCSLYSKESCTVDIDAARKYGILVKGVRDYGDEGVIEFILSQLIYLLKGLGDNQWKAEPVELGGKRLGIIGLGATGTMLAERALAFGMEVRYFSRSRNQLENKSVKYQPLNELLDYAEIISMHLPRNTVILQKEQFDYLGNGKILINTSLGLTFDKKAFLDWISHPENFAIFDADGKAGAEEEFAKFNNIFGIDVASGWTREARERLSRKVLRNVKEYLLEIGN